MLEVVTAGPEFARIPHPEIRDIRNFGSVEATATGGGIYIARLVGYFPEAGISFATGDTQIPVLAAASEYAKGKGISFSRVLGHHLDERYPIEWTNPSAFAPFVEQRASVALGIPKDQMFYWNGQAPDPYAEARRYNKLLKSHHINLAILGAGPPGKDPRRGGHMAFDESGTPFGWECHYVPLLSEETLFRDRVIRKENVPDGALTQGPANIFAADHILLIAYGTEKGVALWHALNDEISPLRPLSGLRLPWVKDKVSIYVDQMAAAVLTAPRL